MLNSEIFNCILAFKYVATGINLLRGKGHTSPKIVKIKNEVAKMSFNLSEHFRCWKVRQVEREQGVNIFISCLM